MISLYPWSTSRRTSSVISCGRAAAQPRPHLGDDAVRAIQDATVLDFHERPAMAVKAADAGRPTRDSEPLENVGQFPVVPNDGDHAGKLRKRFGLAGRIAAENDRLRAGLLFRQLADDLPGLRIGLGRHRAGIDDAQIRRFLSARLRDIPPCSEPL